MTGYYLLRILSWLIYKMPRRVLYFHSDIFFIIVFYLARYRREVVDQNLANSFPEKTKKERDQIASKFYHHLCDCIIETLYFDRITDEEVKKRVTFLNPQLPNDYMDQGKQVLILMGHYNNWECFNNWGLHTKHKSYAIYKKLRNNAFEKFFNHLRSRFGSFPLERALTFRQLMDDSNARMPGLSLFLIDQAPRANDIQYWTTFLNQETAVIVGSEKVARKINAAVLFGNTKKTKRGFYEVEFILITDNAKQCPKFEITEKSTRILEEMIIENPEFWLWSHRKWKHKRPEIE
jgi:Kdo2-lipid IVA lauroyltransferase/acyltransferase